MTGYRVAPQAVDQTLERVRTEADRLGRALEAVWSRLPPAAGGSRIVADALGGFAEVAQGEMSAVGARLEAAPGAVVRAVASILEGDEEMAAATLRGEPLSDPKRFGGTWPSPPKLLGQEPGFDAGRFGGTSAGTGTATGSDS